MGELRKHDLVSRKLVSEIIEVIDFNFAEKIKKKIDEKLETVEHFAHQDQLGMLDLFFKGKKVSDNAFFRDMPSDIVKFILRGFEIQTFLPKECIYNANMPSSNSR